MDKRILVVDIGGTHAKLMISADAAPRTFDSGPKLSPDETVARINEVAAGWQFDAVAIGFPAAVRDGRILKNPTHLGENWVGFDFERALGRPVRLINDAALQALGSYGGSGRMLFLGLGTGLGSALVWEGHVLSLELGHLPYVEQGVLEDRLGDGGLKELGQAEWLREVWRAIKQLQIAFITDQVVLGGGNARLVGELPAGVAIGDNRRVYPGGVRLWETNPATGQPSWRVM